MMAGFEGGCLCGAVRYQSKADPQVVGHCYCVDCRKTSGTGHCTHIGVPADGFSVTGEVRFFDKPADSGNVVSRGFCPTCGSAVYSTNSAMSGLVFPRASKVVFAGDTRQQQPVEAGPGLRLIRDVAGSVRVDRIRRQKADLEDVLVHVHGETPEQARFRSGLTSPQERDAILADYEAMDRKPGFTPWQVAVSEALRDGDAEQAIEAWRLRGRFHLCHDEEKTLTRLVDDWTRHVQAEPDASTVVLARTRAEARALSWLMRERVLGARTDIKRTLIEMSRDLDGRVTEPLEIAVGDRLRIGATQWDKQLFNGTIVTVEDLEVLHEKGRKSSGPAGTGKGGESVVEPSTLITARTDDGRRVTFRHDEIRDYKDNIRIDYGYAMTIASAQGLTVDRAFLLVDDRPARETIYPAATRHREGIDIYVNRSPLAFDIADRRPEDQADMPVTDSDVRAYLAERWSRSQPKEAALDYIADGEWRDPREERRHGPGGTGGLPRARAFGSGIPATAPRVAVPCPPGGTVRQVTVRPRRGGGAHPTDRGIRRR